MQVSSCWSDSLDLPGSLLILKDLALRHARKGGPAGSVIAGLIASGDYKGICEYEIDYSLDWDVLQLIECRQALGYFTKLEDLDIGVNKTDVAFSKFIDAERDCHESNSFFRSFIGGTCFCVQSDTLVLYQARSFIHKVLGRCPRLEDLRLRFGPGATTSIKKRWASPTAKFAETPTCSFELLHSGLLPSLMREIPHWLDCHTESYTIDDDGWLVNHVSVNPEHGHLEFVPKSAKTYRCIDKQPTLNSLLQAGIGDFLEKRLRYAGLNLKDQSLNKRMARNGSIDGLTATIDLSNASDTICTQLVKFLLPTDWYSLLSAARVGSTTYKGRVIPLEKFSSMGNGFTFPLESLIFWALTRASSTETSKVNVYGDDIICAVCDYDRVVRTLKLAGFTVNMAKSFSSGPFRESCGGDYYKGIDIRPYYQKHLVSGSSLFIAHNYFARRYESDVCEAIKHYIPTSIRLYGPDGYGDGHLVSDEWPRRIPRLYRQRGYGGVSFDTYSFTGRKQLSSYPGDYVTPLYTTYINGRVPLLAGCDSLSESTPCEFSKSGRPIWALPGVEGYSKVSIYTLRA